MTSMLRIELPMPPSLWDMYSGHGRHKHLSPAYKLWRDSAGLFVNRQRGSAPIISGPFRASIACRRKNTLADVDNRIKPVLDLLQFMGVVTNDKLCEHVEARWADDLPAECVVIVQRHERGMAA